MSRDLVKEALTALQLAAAARKADPEPTPGQRAAGNYRHGHARVHGLDVTVQVAKGQYRRGVGKDGKEWKRLARAHYGYVRGHVSLADGDHVDVWLGDHPESELAFVVNQLDPATGDFDEHKLVLGARSLAEAKRLYLANYPDGWEGMGEVTPLTVPQLRRWLRHGHTGKPVADDHTPNRKKASAGIPAGFEPASPGPRPGVLAAERRHTGPDLTPGGAPVKAAEHTLTLPDGRVVDVHRLIALVAGREPERLPLAGFRVNRSSNTGFSRKRYAEADTSFPGVVDESGSRILDGKHRVARLRDAGETHGLFYRATDADLEKAAADTRAARVRRVVEGIPAADLYGAWWNPAEGKARVSLGDWSETPGRPVQDALEAVLGPGNAEVEAEIGAPQGEGWEKLAADDAPGLPDRSDYGDWSKLAPGQVHDLVVQRHHADRAGEHLDVRLGSPDTGLYSWATRKPLPAPGERRGVFRQPVHSHGYKDFEGEIASGYGKGRVARELAGRALVTKVTPDSVHVTTAHNRYPERYVFVRGRSDKDWLLVNSTPRGPVPYQKVRHRAVPRDRAEAELAALPEGAVAQPKVDGASTLVRLLRDRAELLSYRTSKENGRPIVHSERFWGGRGAPLDVPPGLVGSVLRGELYGVGPGGKVVHPSELGSLLNASVDNSLRKQREKDIALRVGLFDLQQRGKDPVDLASVPYAERRRMLGELAALLPADRFHLMEQAENPADALKLWRDVEAGRHPLTSEGVVVHPPTGRPWKAKTFDEYDVHVAGTFPGEGRRASTVGGLTYSHEPGGPPAGRVGTGFSDDLLREIAADPGAFVGRVARIRAQERLPSGAYRAPSFLAFHEDLPYAGPAPEPPAKAAGDEDPWADPVECGHEGCDGGPGGPAAGRGDERGGGGGPGEGPAGPGGGPVPAPEPAAAGGDAEGKAERLRAALAGLFEGYLNDGPDGVGGVRGPDAGAGGVPEPAGLPVRVPEAAGPGDGRVGRGAEAAAAERAGVVHRGPVGLGDALGGPAAREDGDADGPEGPGGGPGVRAAWPGLGARLEGLTAPVHENRDKHAALLTDVPLQPHQAEVAEGAKSPEQRLLLFHSLGSGKTRTALAAAETAGRPYTVVTPASLRNNARKEIHRWTDEATPHTVASYNALGRGQVAPTDTVVFDEAHRLRNPNSQTTQRARALADQASHVLLLTGSPVVNSPHDLAPLVGMLTGKDMTPDEFDREFLDERRISPGFLGWLRGVRPGTEQVMKNRDELVDMLRGHVSYYAPAAPNVGTSEEHHVVDLGPEQARLYRGFWDQLPFVTRWKLQRDYPLSREELRRLSSFLAGPRQVSLSPYPFMGAKGDPLEAFNQSPKLRKAVDLMAANLEKDPAWKGVAFSNFVDAGLTPYGAALKARGVPYGVFHGGLDDAARKAVVDDYNAGRTRVLLLGPAGGEGISLKGTRQLQVLDPHWNSARSEQAVGRGVRFDSHADLPEDQRNVLIQRFASRLPLTTLQRVWRAFGGGGGDDARRSSPGVDQYLERMDERKDALNRQFEDALREAAQKGPRRGWFF